MIYVKSSNHLLSVIFLNVLNANTTNSNTKEKFIEVVMMVVSIIQKNVKKMKFDITKLFRKSEYEKEIEIEKRIKREYLNVAYNILDNDDFRKIYKHIRGSDEIEIDNLLSTSIKTITNKELRYWYFYILYNLNDFQLDELYDATKYIVKENNIKVEDSNKEIK